MIPPARQRSATSYNALKTAWRVLCDQAGGIDAVAAFTRTTRSLAAAFGSINVADRFAPIDAVLDLESLTQRPAVTETLARLQGFALVAIEPRGAGDLAAKLAELGRDVSAVFATAATALAHDHLTEPEHEALLRQLAEVGRVVTEAQQLLAVGLEIRAVRGRQA